MKKWLNNWERLGLIGLALVAGEVAHGATYYVATNGVESYSGTNWAEAVATISNAVAKTVDNDTVIVSNGTYSITRQILITNAITVQSLSGPEVTTVQRVSGTSRIFFVSNATALVSGFTITGGNTNGPGGGVYLGAGTVSNCVITANPLGSYATGGGGVYMLANTLLIASIVQSNSIGHDTYGGGIRLEGGLVQNCIIRGNRCGTGTSSGGGVYAGSGTIRNCLIVGNVATNPGVASPWGGGVYGGTVENCTIYGNTAKKGGGVYSSTVRNSIIYGNNALGPDEQNYSGSTFTFSCTTPAAAGTRNIASDPSFVDATAGDFRLRPGSPCIDGGTNYTWMSGAKDLAGNDRIMPAGGTNDMGAYEYGAGALACSFAGTPTFALLSNVVVFTAFADGTNLTGVGYLWDFTNDSAYDTGGPDQQTVTNTYDLGSYSVKLTVTNAAGETATMVRPGYIKVSPAVIYVATNGTHSSPYTNWVTAATNIQAGLDLSVSGAVVRASNGVYAISQALTVDSGITLESVGGPSSTVIRLASGEARVLTVTGPGALVNGFTLTGGSLPRQSSQGGGLYLGAGIASNCVITGNTIGYGNTGGGGVYMAANTLLACSTVQSNTLAQDNHGAGIYMAGGRAQNCVIRNNVGGTGACNGGGVYLNAGALLRGCLLYGNATTNASVPYGGGAYGGVLESCTVAGNVSKSGGGGVYNSTVTNSIVYFNTATASSDNNYNSGTAFRYSCTTPGVAGAGNVAGDPTFVGAVSNNYRLMPGSPCIDTATNLGWMTAAVDLDGNPRIIPASGTNDMGAYEYTSGPLACSFVGTPTAGYLSNTVVFTASVDGMDLTGLGYRWDFDNDLTYDSAGTDKKVVTNYYSAVGLYSVRLVVTNAAGEVAQQVRPNYIKVAPAIVYVATNGTQTAPYTNWVTAATNLQAGIDMGAGGSVVRISNGVYAIANALIIDFPVRIESVNGPSNTVVQAAGATLRVLSLSHSNALVSGLTLRNGNIGPGSGVNMSAGTVSNCIISGNTVPYGSTGGGGVYIAGANALLVGSLIESNSLGQDNHGAGIYMNVGMVRNCVIRNNSGGPGTSGGGGVYALAGTVQNCLIYGNSATNAVASAFGGGVWGGVVENCTLCDNAARDGGGLYNSTATNSIVYFNTVITAVAGTNYNSGCTLRYCDSLPLAAGAGNCAGDPLFRNRATGNYRPYAESPCANTGTNLAWMSAGAIDLGGNLRILGPRVDIGAYEIVVPPKGTVTIVR